MKEKTFLNILARRT